MNEVPIRIVCATRLTYEGFFQHSPLGRSLKFIDQNEIELQIFAENKQGLPSVYNQAIRMCTASPRILIFMHDDVNIFDYHWTNRVRLGLTRFDILGVVGNIRRVKFQPTWFSLRVENKKLVWDRKENLSGILAHGDGFPPFNLSKYGEPGKAVKLIDGVFIAVHSSLCHSKKLLFDERFEFHFYDLDLCRTAETLGIRIGTWPISLSHLSKGNFITPEWLSEKDSYFSKWAD